MPIDIGLEDAARKKISDALRRFLADSYVLYMRTHGYHWNVEGPRFNSLHQMFEEQYTELWGALDDLAERIRALGAYAPGNGKELAEVASLAEPTNDRPDADGMVRALLNGHESLARDARELIDLAGDAGDVGTEDMITARLQVHEKTAWMLRASLAQ
ncbi:MAG: Dps family protein [Pseudomonadota bacterium]